MSMIKFIQTIFFSEMSFEESSHKINNFIGLLSFIIIAAIFVIPLTESSRKAFFHNLILEIIVLFVVFTLVYLFSCLVKLSFFNPLSFFKNVSFYFMLSLVIIFLPALFISQFIVLKYFNNEVLGRFIFTFFTYYAFVLFGWLSEKAIGEKGFKGILIALFAITMISLMFFNLGNFTK